MFNESFLTKEDVTLSNHPRWNMFLWRCRESHQPAVGQRCSTANCEPLRKFDLFFTLSDYRREQRGPERCSESREKHNGQLQNWKSELQIDAISPSTVITRLEIIDCERMSMMPWPWSSWSRMFPSDRWSRSLEWSWGQFLINTCITTRSQPPADSLIT